LTLDKFPESVELAKFIFRPGERTLFIGVLAQNESLFPLPEQDPELFRTFMYWRIPSDRRLSKHPVDSRVLQS
jgi:hypothetical protein